MLPRPSLLLWIDIFLWQEQIRNCRFHYSEESIQIFSWLCRINGIFLTSAVNVVSSNPCVGLSPEVNISLFSLPICADELIQAPKIMTFFTKPPTVNENSERESNPLS